MKNLETSTKVSKNGETKIKTHPLFLKYSPRNGNKASDEVVSGFLSNDSIILSDLNQDLTENYGSNACVYLCSKIAEELFKCSWTNILS